MDSTLFQTSNEFVELFWLNIDPKAEIAEELSFHLVDLS